MKEKGLYYIDDSFSKVVKVVNGEWNDKKHRPVVCLLQSTENNNIYWAIPMGKYNHRDQIQIDRLNNFLNRPSKDLSSCYYHVGRTTTKSIFFISDVVPITSKYLKEEHLGADQKHFVIKNTNLISELTRKVNRILAFEKSKPNYFRQHITDIKVYLINELNQENNNTPYKMPDSKAAFSKSKLNNNAELI